MKAPYIVTAETRVVGTCTVDRTVVAVVALAQPGTVEDVLESVADELDKTLLEDNVPLVLVLDDSTDGVDEPERSVELEMVLVDDAPEDELKTLLELRVLELGVEVVDNTLEDDWRLELVTGVLVADTTLLELEIDTDDVVVGPATTPVPPQTIFNDTGRGVAYIVGFALELATEEA